MTCLYHDVEHISLAGSVVLDGPVHPVTEGRDAILTCRCNDRRSPCDLSSTFYKDGVMAGSGIGGVLTLHNVSVYDEGFYACEIIGTGRSPESWLSIRGEDVHHGRRRNDKQVVHEAQCVSVLPPAGPDPPSIPHLLRLHHLLVGMPFLICTLMLGVIYRDRGEGTGGDGTGRGGEGTSWVRRSVLKSILDLICAAMTKDEQLKKF